MSKELLIELSLAQLHQSAVAAFPDTRKRQHATDTLNVSAIKLIPHDNALMIKTVVTNTNGGKTYDNTILVLDVKFVDEDGPNVITFTGSDGEEHHVQPINSRANKAKVQCNCLDLHWRFATWDFSKDALLGKPPAPYTKKTDRPDANPKQMPGICKHLMASIEAIQNSNLIR